jgi:hypothetical protein
MSLKLNRHNNKYWILLSEKSLRFFFGVIVLDIEVPAAWYSSSSSSARKIIYYIKMIANSGLVGCPGPHTPTLEERYRITLAQKQ